MKNSLAAIAVLGCALACVAGEPVPLRGVVEGYYGRPWGTEGRLSLLKFMGETDMNMFIYGPKDDPYHHFKWREPYPESEMADFRRLLACARENGVSLYWAIHLGDGFHKGREADYADLFKKLQCMYDGGFRAFAVFFDDFGGDDASFHAEICNRVVRDFLARRGDCAPLVMCPYAYWGYGQKYQKTLGEALDQSVMVMWTGKGICSDIRADDVARITEDLRRPPLIWWNWPVNDYCRSSLLLGRTYGLDSCRIAGLVSNPMENCEASKIALYGVAKWCADPEAFDSRKAWEESFGKLYADQEVAAAMRVLAEHNSDQGPNVHGFRREESVSASDLCRKARAELDADGRLSDGTCADVARLFGEVRGAVRVLDEKLPKGRNDLGWEIEGWLGDEACLMEQGEIAVELLRAASYDSASAGLAAMRDARRRAAESAKRHREKFAADTFEDDRRFVSSPKASSRELRPLVEKLAIAALKRLYRMKTGRDFDSAESMKAFSTAKSLGSLAAVRDGKVAGLSRVLEPCVVAPGETFGIALPKGWTTDYFHARLGSAAAVEAGVIEVSKDGASWTKLNTGNKGDEMQLRLNPADGWRQARYRNASASQVEVRIGLFKFDVSSGGQGPIDALLEEL